TATLQVTPSLQAALTQVAYCYSTGLDLIALGDVQAGTNELHACFTDDAEVVYDFPPAFEALKFKATGGPEGLAQAVVGIYQTLHIIRTQHMVTNVVVQRTGETTATMRSYITAAHMHPDERVLNATAKYLDDVRYIDGQWKIAYRQVTITSLTHLPAFS